MSSILVQYDDLDFSETVEEIEISQPHSIVPMKVPKRHGAVVQEVPTLDPVRISMRGKIQEQDLDTLLTTLGNFQKTFSRFNKKLYIYNDRYYYAYVLSFGYKYIEGAVFKSLAYSIDFFCADPFQYSTTEVTDSRTLNSSDTAIDITNNIYRESFTLNNPGNSYVYPKFTITPANDINSVIIRNITTGRNITYTGTVTSGQSLVIDCANLTVTNNGTEDLTNFSGSFLWLNAGNNSFQYEGKITATYVCNFVPRYN